MTPEHARLAPFALDQRPFVLYRRTHAQTALDFEEAAADGVLAFVQQKGGAE